MILTTIANLVQKRFRNFRANNFFLVLFRQVRHLLCVYFVPEVSTDETEPYLATYSTGRYTLRGKHQEGRKSGIASACSRLLLACHAGY